MATTRRDLLKNSAALAAAITASAAPVALAAEPVPVLSLARQHADTLNEAGRLSNFASEIRLKLPKIGGLLNTARVDDRAPIVIQSAEEIEHRYRKIERAIADITIWSEETRAAELAKEKAWHDGLLAEFRATEEAHDRAYEASGLEAIEEQSEATWAKVQEIAATPARSPAAKLAIVAESMWDGCAITDDDSDGRLLFTALADAQRLAGEARS